MFHNPDELVELGIAEKQPDGSFVITDFEAFEALPFNRMMTLVRRAYVQIRCAVMVKELTKSESQEILSLWFSCTRSVPVSDPNFRNSEAIKKDHEALGILGLDGELNEVRIEQLAKQIWTNPNHFPSFDELLKSQN